MIKLYLLKLPELTPRGSPDAFALERKSAEAECSTSLGLTPGELREGGLNIFNVICFNYTDEARILHG